MAYSCPLAHLVERSPDKRKVTGSNPVGATKLNHMRKIMPHTIKYAKNLKEVSKLAREFAQSMQHATGDSFEWSMEQMADSYISMFERFCPYKEGDEVELLKDVPCEGSGWSSCKHFLIRGATATVHSCGYNDGKFTFDVIFDEESWIDDGGEVHPVETNKHTFGLNETYFRKIP